MTHPIDGFLDLWRDAGGDDSIELRLRVYRALRLPGEWTLVRLRATLRALLARDANELARFESAFERAFDVSLETKEFVEDWSERLKKLPAVAPRRDPRREEVERYVEARRSWWWGPSFVLVSVLVGAAVYAERAPPPAEVGGSPSATHSASAPSASASVPAPPSSAPPVVRLPEPAEEPANSWRPPRSELALLGAFALLLAIALGAAGWRFRKRERSRYEPAKGATEEFRGPDLMTPSPEPVSPLSSRELSELAYNLSSISDESLEVDIARTVDATARNRLLKLVHRKRRRPPSIAVVAEPSHGEVLEQLISSFSVGLSRHGLSVERLTELPDAASYDAGLLFVDARDVSQQVLSWFARAKHFALVEARDPLLWGVEVRRLPVDPHPPTPDGLRAALRTALHGPRLPAAAHPVAIDAIERIGDALPIAAAAALVQPLDLTTLDRLRRELSPSVPFAALQRILEAPGVTVSRGSITCDHAFTSLVRREVDDAFQRRVLAWNRDQRLKLCAPRPGTRADAMLKREFAFTALHLLALGVETSEAEVEAHVAVLERQKSVSGLRERMTERISELTLWVGNRMNSARDQLSSGLAYRLGQLGLAEAFPRTWPSVDKLALSAFGLGAALLFGLSVFLGGEAFACPSGEQECRGACIAASRTCDSCLGACEGSSPFCVAGQCSATACGDCGVKQCCGSSCVDTQVDRSHCGRCGNSCGPQDGCQSGVCAPFSPIVATAASTCAPGLTRCGDVCVSLEGNNDHCGACGEKCAEGFQCSGGLCSSTGDNFCADGGTFCAGDCVDLLRNAKHCGTCNNSCSSAATCVQGTCRLCPRGYGNCDLIGSCETSVLEDDQNCGRCGVQCGENAACLNGQCTRTDVVQPACQAGYTRCGEYCLNLQVSESACGACGRKCRLDQDCVSGECVCPPDTMSCGNDCVRLDSMAHCGRCGNACRPGEDCRGGTCSCTEGLTSCDRGARVGCTINLRSDPTNCGACGVRCASGKCSNGACVAVEKPLSCLDKCQQTLKQCLAQCQSPGDLLSAGCLTACQSKNLACRTGCD